MKFKYEELKLKSVSRKQRCFSPVNRDFQKDLEYQENVAFPAIDYIKSTSISKYNFMNENSHRSEEEIKLEISKRSKEFNTKLNIRISDRCKDLIKCSQFPACSNIKLRRKLRMLSASPKRNITHFIQGLSCVSKDQVLANHLLLAQRSKMREQVMQNLNLKGRNKELTRKVFELCINLKNKSAL